MVTRYRKSDADQILIKAMCILALKDLKVAVLLRQCSISIALDAIEDGSADPSKWYVLITSPSDIFVTLFHCSQTIKDIFRYLVGVEGGKEVTSFKIVREKMPQADLVWKDAMRSQQQDFIERLKQSPPSLLKCDTVGSHSESIIISSASTERLRKFCWEMVNKYKRSSQSSYETFISTMKGKLGEEALVNLLGDYVTEVDYEVKRGGDGKIDFKLSQYPSIGIQVKARNGSVDDISWFTDSKEIELNSVLVCFLIQEEVTEAQPEYHIIAAGFIPTATIDQTKLLAHNNKTAAFKIDELRYMGGLRSYLEFLKKGEDLKFKKERINLSSPHFNLEQVWEEVTDYAKRLTRALFKPHGCLLAFDGETARVGCPSQALFGMFKQQLPTIEAAFADIYGCEIRVSVEVMSPELLLEKDISLKN